ncbi:hypothetical protein SAMN04244581_05163 [Paracoccus denitrificans]|jgi:hypothetical protein|nr:hypothetical protein [Paracoccus denitrificans]GEK71419.1 hypothetical protein PDE01_49390 [Paracoccus denitrificans]SDJ97152.1 hypothetical protein SAMN04244581_05163 [Paracoccus denitrificans]SFR23314.1 hypothetical protein SAMN04244569_05141 [Paracoccus denitrificans]
MSPSNSRENGAHTPLESHLIRENAMLRRRLDALESEVRLLASSLRRMKSRLDDQSQADGAIR